MLLLVGTPPVSWVRMEFFVYVMEKGRWRDSGELSCRTGRGLLGAPQDNCGSSGAGDTSNDVRPVTADS